MYSFRLREVSFYTQIFKNKLRSIMSNNNKQANFDRIIHKIQNLEAPYLAYKQLLAGDIIALPTDTVYGLACDANNEEAIKKLYDIKGRVSHKPVAICVKNLTDFRYYGDAEHLSDALLNHLLPGPITIIVQRSFNLKNRFLNPETNKIGIRIPDFPFIEQICTLLNNQPLALTSANRSFDPSSLNINEFEQLWPQLGGIFDGGQISPDEQFRLASTVIDLSLPGYYKLIRNGIALKETLKVMKDFGLKTIK